MKKILTYLTAASMAAVLAASCNKNEAPVFDDANAFIAFSAQSYTVKEKIDTSSIADTIKIPVSLASVAGLEGAVTYTVTADTTEKKGKKYVPKEGVNYKILTEGGTLKFDKDHRTQYIEITGIYFNEYTGDLNLKIALSSKTTKLGYNKACTVTISDFDNPLAPILGDYKAVGEDYWDGVTDWTMTLKKDDADEHKVWIHDIANMGASASAIGPFYGTVDDDLTTITIPFGQENSTTATVGGKKLMLLGFDGEEGYDKGSTTATINKDPDGKVLSLTFDDAWGFWVWGSPSYAYGLILPGIVATKL